jgi:hypothetical protein
VQNHLRVPNWFVFADLKAARTMGGQFGSTALTKEILPCNGINLAKLQGRPYFAAVCVQVVDERYGAHLAREGAPIH